jgi:hypothetical protein
MKAIYFALALTVVVAVIASRVHAADAAAKNADTRVYELRTYYAADGKMDALQARFRDHTCNLFKKHGMTIVGFWNPTKPEDSQKKLIYILSFPSMDAAKASWKAFQDDPEWKAARKESEKNGRLVDKVESVYMNPTDYSPLK